MSGGDAERSGIHADWVESEMEDIKAGRWYRQKVDKLDKEREKKERSIFKRNVDKEVRKQEKRLRIVRRRENATEEEKKRGSGEYRYF